MRRCRSWRRFQEEKKIISRLKNRFGGWRILNANDQYVENPIWIDLIGTKTHFMFKQYTSKYSNWNEKWGQKGKGKHTEGRYKSCRGIDKKAFKKMLEMDYGIKHFNIGYGFI